MSLSVEFLDEMWELEPGQDLSFGRAADLVVDESNLFLHRVLGVFRHARSTWWLHNAGEWLELEVRTDRGSTHSLVPGARVALVVPAMISFAAGKAKYAIRAVPAEPLDDSEVRIVLDAPRTNRFGVIELNDEQRLVLTALCEKHLLDPSSNGSLPSNRAIAHRLGWSITKFNRKLDYLCRRLATAGVTGLKGAPGERAADRRLRLVEHALATELISSDDLDRLEAG